MFSCLSVLKSLFKKKQMNGMAGVGPYSREVQLTTEKQLCLLTIDFFNFTPSACPIAYSLRHNELTKCDRETRKWENLFKHSIRWFFNELQSNFLLLHDSVVNAKVVEPSVGWCWNYRRLGAAAFFIRQRVFFRGQMTQNVRGERE